MLANSVSFEKNLLEHFEEFRSGIIGINQRIKTPNHESIPILYADWIASGRCYRPIEERLMEEFMPFAANTHTETSHCGKFMTSAYNEARQKIKNHVKASSSDVLISSGSGMTDGVNKLQRILGLRIPEQFQKRISIKEEERPVVFLTHMEHHSNHTSWLETICEVIVVPPSDDGLVSLVNFEEAFLLYPNRLKIAAITACSNVTGIETPYYQIAGLVHRYGGYCFVDFACSAPYVNIDMHPREKSHQLDAIFFSPHKFLGGPGASGILVFNRALYQNETPDNSGGGTVDWTNPWGGRKYLSNIEEREDGGTPAIFQTIKAAMAIELKEEMGVENILDRERSLLKVLWEGLESVLGMNILASEHKERLGVISFFLDEFHYDDVVQRLNDRFGIQSRGGCSCAGTYGHLLLDVGREGSKEITDLIDRGDTSEKPGWVRVSVHPTMTEEEVNMIVEAVDAIV